MIRRKNATGVDIKVEFKFMDKVFTESIDIPFGIFVEAFRQYSSRYKDVVIDGTDTRIWNLLVSLDATSKLEYDTDFLEIAKDLYTQSRYFEEDQEEWLEEMQDDYNFQNNLGEYAPKE
jgi:hypothetical protein